MLTGEFNIQLKNASSGTVVKNITLPAIITDFYKYESTSGFPFMNRFAITPDKTSDRDAYCVNTAMVNSSGIRLFNENLDEDKHKMQVDISNTYCAFASRYASGANAHSSSNKAGYMTNYTFGQPDFRNADGNKLTMSFSWHWDADKGNGTFKSVGTGHQSGVNALSSDTLFTDFIAVNAEAGHDWKYLSGMNVGSWDYPEDFSISLMSDGSNSMVYNNPIYAMAPFMHFKSSAIGRDFYYQTDTNIVHLWASTLNETDESGNYITHIKYKVINKKWLYRFCIGIAQGMHPLGSNNWYINEDNFEDGDITINTGAYPLRLFGASDSNEPNFALSAIEDCSYCIFFADAGEEQANPNPDGDSINWSLTRPQDCYIIAGDTPTLRVLHTYYDSYLTAMYQSRSNDYAPARSITLFCKDFSYIMLNRYTDGNIYLIRRYITNDTRIYKINLGYSRDINAFYDLGFFRGSGENTFGLISNHDVYANLVADEPGRSMPVKICNISDGQQTGYATAAQCSGWELRNILQSTILRGQTDSPYYIFINPNWTDRRFEAILNTNFLFAKANLEEEITKTSEHTLDVTLTLHIY